MDRMKPSSMIRPLHLGFCTPFPYRGGYPGPSIPRVGVRPTRVLKPYMQVGGSMSDREAEIAAKIEKLRAQGRLKIQKKKDDSREDAQNSEQRGENKSKAELSGSSRYLAGEGFSGLPDWKKQQVLEQQMRNAEAFLKLNKAPKDKHSGFHENISTDYSSHDNDGSPALSHIDKTRAKDVEKHVAERKRIDEEYKPKVSTWGMFPRPQNISEAYGGGKSIPLGGRKVPSDDPQAIQSENRTKDLLAEYRKQHGIDQNREEAHADDISRAVAAAQRHMKNSSPADAVRELQAVVQYVSPRSQRGGDVYLNLALAHEDLGQRHDAREIYMQLKSSPFQIISRKAKNLLVGFDAMDSLRMGEETVMSGEVRVGKFTLPDVAAMTDKRYETVLVPDSSKLASKAKNQRHGKHSSNSNNSINENVESAAKGFEIGSLAFAAFVFVLGICLFLKFTQRL